MKQDDYLNISAQANELLLSKNVIDSDKSIKNIFSLVLRKKKTKYCIAEKEKFCQNTRRRV